MLVTNNYSNSTAGIINRSYSSIGSVNTERSTTGSFSPYVPFYEDLYLASVQWDQQTVAASCLFGRVACVCLSVYTLLLLFHLLLLLLILLFHCPNCDRTFISHIGLVGRLRIHHTEADKPVPEAPTYTHHTRLHCPHYPRTFTHRMSLFGHMRIHENGIDRSPDSSIMPNSTLTSSPCAPTALPATGTDTTDFACPHCLRTFTSRIGLAGHLRVHRTETGEPLPGAAAYTHHIRLNCPHCPRTFRHRMDLCGDMRIHESGIDRNSDPAPPSPHRPARPSPPQTPPPPRL
nr:unnamed protein product [Spirometra erinaceieuropaei]